MQYGKEEYTGKLRGEEEMKDENERERKRDADRQTERDIQGERGKNEILKMDIFIQR